MKYGLPYKGSKSRLAERIIDHLPGARVFYDLFAGGCAITHAALLSGKYEKVVANDIAAYPALFRDAALGKYRNDYRWVSREDFFKSQDPFDRVIFSFGNDCRTYIYAAGEVENWKKALHYAICFHDYDPMRRLGYDLSSIESCRTIKERRMKAYQIIGGTHGWWKKDVHLENLERLERLQNLERLEQFQNLERLEIYQGNYFDIHIENDAVIYLDPPYAGTNGYGGKKKSDFDSDALYDWIDRQTVPVFISEYKMPSDRFECIWGTETKSYINADSPRVAVEKLFISRNARQIKTTLF